MAHFGKKKIHKTSVKPADAADMDTFIKKVREETGTRESEYRSRSLEIHPWICAKCGREFDAGNIHLLTVHHRDGNHNNNPPDGSNWENLCVFCHEDEHARGILADYITDDPDGNPEGVEQNNTREPQEGSGGLGTLGDILKRKLGQKH